MAGSSGCAGNARAGVSDPRTSSPLGVCPGVGQLAHVAVLFVVSKEAP